MVRRASRYYDGTDIPGKKIADLLPKILLKIQAHSENEKEAIFDLWSSLLGVKIAPLTEFVSLRDQVLTIKVKSATLYSLLCQHEKARLLKQLQEKFPIRDLIFRIG